MCTRWIAVVGLLLVVPAYLWAEDAEPLTVLDTANLWRVRTVRETIEVLTPSGTVAHVQFKTPQAYDFFQKNPDRNEVPRFTTEEIPVIRLPSSTSPDWFKLDFDDSTWARLRGPFLAGSTDDNWKLILIRGRFAVTDVARVGDLKLSLKFRGGAVVYLNGEEIARFYMPQGPLDLYTPAEPYPRDVYL
ncbi:MAG: hypothetical protein ACUVWX_10745, partial [Kiritimatiellia bacterium]